MSIKQKDVIAKDPNDYNYVSVKNWVRKQRILSGGDKLGNIVGRPGPISGFALGTIDVIITLIVKICVNVFIIAQYAFDWMYNMIFGLFNGIIPSSIVGGTVISMRYVRYFVTAVMPPFGIFAAKGIYGWFSVIVCIVITYINFLAGMVYAFVVTSRNRYSDQYEAKNIADAMSDSNNQTLDSAMTDSSALLGTCGFSILFLSVIFLCLSFF